MVHQYTIPTPIHSLQLVSRCSTNYQALLLCTPAQMLWKQPLAKEAITLVQSDPASHTGRTAVSWVCKIRPTAAHSALELNERWQVPLYVPQEVQGSSRKRLVETAYCRSLLSLLQNAFDLQRPVYFCDGDDIPRTE